jgi:hypothetical protein
VLGLRHHVTQRGNRREPVFFRGRQLSSLPATGRRGSAARRHSRLGLLPDAQSRPPANHAHLA